MKKHQIKIPLKERGSSQKNSTSDQLKCSLCNKPVELSNVWTLHAKYDYLCYDCFVNKNPK